MANRILSVFVLVGGFIGLLFTIGWLSHGVHSPGDYVAGALMAVLAVLAMLTPVLT